MPLFIIEAQCQPTDEFTETWLRVDALVEAESSIEARMRLTRILRECRMESRQLCATQVPRIITQLASKFEERKARGIDWVFEVS